MYQSAHIHLFLDGGETLVYGVDAKHGTLAAFGGFREPWETMPMDTAIREFMEETLGVVFHTIVLAVHLWESAILQTHVGRQDGQQHMHYFLTSALSMKQADIDAAFTSKRQLLLASPDPARYAAQLENARLLLIPVAKLKKKLVAQTSHLDPITIGGVAIRQGYVPRLREYLGLVPYL